MKIILIIALLINATFSYAACNTFYPNNKPIVIEQTIELCNSFYVSVFSTQQNGVLFSSELFKLGQTVTRVNGFSADKRLPKEHRHAPTDYKNSGFDRGHLTPAADAKSNEQMNDTFLLSNIAPQEPLLNRKAWKELEETIRKNIRSNAIIVTGVLYEDFISNMKTENKIGKKQIPVPVAFFKIIYKNEILTQPVAYYALNKPNATVIRLTVDGLNKRSGYNFPVE